MTDVRTSRLVLHAIDVAEGERIVARSAGPADAWADDFPFEGDVGAVGGFLRASAALGEQRPSGGSASRANRTAAASRSVTAWLPRPGVTATPRRRSSPY